MESKFTFGTLYCHDSETSKTFELGNVQDITLTTTDTVDVKPIIVIKEPITFSVENAQWNLTNRIVRQLLGLPITNNWLKMHGYPMRRRKRK